MLASWIVDGKLGFQAPTYIVKKMALMTFIDVVS